MNQYSVWKYLLILIIITVGFVYALPNIYGEDPALQITSSRGFALPVDLTTNIDDALVREQISFNSSEQQGNRLLYRFDNTEDQIRAADAVREALGDQYVVALNLAHATPDALRAIGGKPMTLGLDLQGGLRLAYEVQVEAAVDEAAADDAAEEPAEEEVEEKVEEPSEEAEEEEGDEEEAEEEEGDEEEAEEEEGDEDEADEEEEE